MNTIKSLYNKHKLVVNSILLTLIGMCGLWYTLSISGLRSFYNTLLVFSSIPFFFFCKNTLAAINNTDLDQKEKKKLCITAEIISVLLSASFIIGEQLKWNEMTSGGFVGKLTLILAIASLSVVIFPFSYYLTKAVENSGKCGNLNESSSAINATQKFLIAFGVIFVSYIPVFLAYYPSIMAYDFHRQSQEAMKGFAWFYPYQPLAHTWVYWLFFKLRFVLGSLEKAMAAYSIFQMLLQSASLGYASVMVLRITKKKWTYITSIVFFAIFPLISIMSVEATKDVIFTASFVTFFLLLIERYMFPHKNMIVFDILWLLDGIIMVLFRNNAVYALIVYVLLHIIFSAKKEKLRTAIMGILMIILGQGAVMAMPKIIGTQIPAPQIEKYSVIVQAFGNVISSHPDDLDPAASEILQKYIPNEAWENYNPYISDSTKGVIQAYREEPWLDTKQLVTDWIKVGIKYPGDYIDSIFLTNAGYLFFDDVSWCEMLGYGPEGRMGAVYTYNSTTSDVIPNGIVNASKLPFVEKMMEKIVSENCFYNWPVISILFKPALYVWIMIIGFILLIYKKQHHKVCMLIYPLCYFLTMLLGPCVHWRYAFPFAVIAPIIFAMLFTRETE